MNQAGSPSLSRRTLLAAAAGTTLSGTTLSGAALFRPAIAQGARRLVVRDAGGAFSAGFGKAFYEAFKAETGIEVVGVQASFEPTAQIKAIVEAKSYTWDVADLSQSAAALLESQGLLEPHGLEGDANVGAIPATLRSAAWVGMDVFSACIAYRQDAFRSRPAPETWADFWDTARFPGRRGLARFPYDTVEIALLADGVPADKLYPCDLDRAFRKLDAIKPKVDVWFTSGAQNTQLLQTGEIDLCMTWNARAQEAIDNGAPVTIGWGQHLWAGGGWGILKGGPKVEMAREFVRFCARPDRQAAFTPYLAYGPSNPNAYKFVDPARAKALPTSPENFGKGVRVDYQWRSDVKDALVERFNAWIVS